MFVFNLDNTAFIGKSEAQRKMKINKSCLPYREQCDWKL